MCFFFFKQKTAYEMRISDWSSDVCSSDLILDLAKMEAGSIDWEMRQLDPRAVIEEAIAVTSALFAAKAVRLAVRVAASLPQVHASRHPLISVLANPLSKPAQC